MRKAFGGMDSQPRRRKEKPLFHDPIAKARAMCLEQAQRTALLQCSDMDPLGALTKPRTPPELYSLVELDGEIIPSMTMLDLEPPVEALKALHAAGTLSKKVFGAWRMLQCSPEMTVSPSLLCLLSVLPRCLHYSPFVFFFFPFLHC